MVVLTIVTKKNGEEIYFEDQLPEANYVRLLSCSFYNSWDTLKKEDSANIELRENVKSVSKFPPGHYDLESLAKEISSMFDKYNYKLNTVTNTPVGQLVIINSGLNPIELDSDLANFLGIGRKLMYKTFVIRFTSPKTYFVHCDLIDPSNNFFTGKKSNLLAKVDVRRKPYEKVTYNIDSSQNVFRDASTAKSFNKITISVRDENGELFDFEGLPLEFELEIK